MQMGVLMWLLIMALVLTAEEKTSKKETEEALVLTKKQSSIAT